LNLKEKVSIVPSLISKPDDFHCSSINFIIKPLLLWLFIKKGSDKFSVAFLRDFEVLNIGISKYILSSPINLMKVDSSYMLPSK
jgi:hypothetical protein